MQCKEARASECGRNSKQKLLSRLDGGGRSTGEHAMGDGIGGRWDLEGTFISGVLLCSITET